MDVLVVCARKARGDGPRGTEAACDLGLGLATMRTERRALLREAGARQQSALVARLCAGATAALDLAERPAEP